MAAETAEQRDARLERLKEAAEPRDARLERLREAWQKRLAAEIAERYFTV